MATATLPLHFFHFFSNLPDPRCVSRTRYRLLDLIFIALTGILAGAEDWHQIEIFAATHKDWLRKFCRLPATDEMPRHDTLERLFKRLNPRLFADCFRHWTTALAQHLGLKQIAIDGKTLRGSAAPQHGLRALHLVSAWATDIHLSLGQVAVDTKSNEITAIPELLKWLEVKGALVTLDAMGCQKAIAEQIVEAEADYLLIVKENHKRLHADICWTFALATALEFDGLRYDCYQEPWQHGHGRHERRRYEVLNNLGLIRDRAEWSGLTMIGRCTHEREVAGEVKAEVRYFIGSRRMTAQEYGAGLRGHWGIENNLHWQLDVSFREDANQVEDRNAAQNLAALRRLALSLLKRHPSKRSIANKRFQASMDVDFLEQVLQTGQSE